MAVPAGYRPLMERMVLESRLHHSWKPDKVATFFIGPTKATPAQVAKYNQILEAAYRLVDEEGYEALQMRVISDVSGVALATIYRYFKSRDYLAFVMSFAWISEVTASVTFTPDQTPTLGEAKEIIRTTAAILEEHPNLLRTFARSVLTSDAYIAEERLHVRQSFDWVAPKGVDAGHWKTTVQYMETVYLAGLLRWTAGQQSYEAIAEDVCGIMEICAKAFGLFGDPATDRH
jgi:AcrR family transcriptional regulator